MVGEHGGEKFDKLLLNCIDLEYGCISIGTAFEATLDGPDMSVNYSTKLCCEHEISYSCTSCLHCESPQACIMVPVCGSVFEAGTLNESSDISKGFPQKEHIVSVRSYFWHLHTN